MATPRIGNFDATENQLHRVVVNSQVRMHQAQHMDQLQVGASSPKGREVRSGTGSSKAGSPFGKLSKDY